MQYSTVFKHGMVLACFALVTTGIVGLTHDLTEDKIQEQISLQRQKLIEAVVPKDYYDNDVYNDCIEVESAALGGKKKIYRARENGVISAYILETTATKGYNGDIDMIIGITPEPRVISTRVLKHKETPGLGDKIELAVSDWILGFDNQAYSADQKSKWQVRKDGGQFDQFSGATITPRAVVRTIANTLDWVSSNQLTLNNQKSNCQVVESND